MAARAGGAYDDPSRSERIFLIVADNFIYNMDVERSGLGDLTDLSVDLPLVQNDRLD